MVVFYGLDNPFKFLRAFFAIRHFWRPAGAYQPAFEPLDRFAFGDLCRASQCHAAADDECGVEAKNNDEGRRKIPIVEVAVTGHAEQEHDDKRKIDKVADYTGSLGNQLDTEPFLQDLLAHVSFRR